MNLNKNSMNQNQPPYQQTMGQRPMGQMPRYNPQQAPQSQDNQFSQGFNPNEQANYQPSGMGYAPNGYENIQNSGIPRAKRYESSPLNKKGKLGINFVILGIIAWLMVASQLTTSLVIFVIMCIFIEQDETLTKVLMSAVTFMVAAFLLLSGWQAIYGILYYLISGAASSSKWIILLSGITTAARDGLSSLNGLVSKIFDIVMVVMGAKYAISLSKGQVTESKLINKLFKI